MRLIDADRLNVAFAVSNAQDFAKGGLPDYVTDWVELGIAEAPTVDAVPIVHGKWLSREKGCLGKNWFIYSCSICESGAPEEGTCKTPYCPICGAKMDGGKS